MHQALEASHCQIPSHEIRSSGFIALRETERFKVTVRIRQVDRYALLCQVKASSFLTNYTS